MAGCVVEATRIRSGAGLNVVRHGFWVQFEHAHFDRIPFERDKRSALKEELDQCFAQKRV